MTAFVDPALNPRVGTAEVATPVSAVSWPAIFAGAFTAGSITLVMLALGSALGLAGVSPWRGVGASAAAFSVGAGVYLVITQWLSAALGGYITGRLRLRWVGLHTHETTFRDTAHGFITWAVSTVIAVALVASAVSMAGGAAVRAGGNAANGALQGAARNPQLLGQTQAYDLDMLFRANQPAANSGTGTGGAPVVNSTGGAPVVNSTGAAQAPTSNGGPNSASSQGDQRGEASRILAIGLRDGGNISQPDHDYMASLVAARTGMSQADATKRVDDVIAREKAAIAQAKQAADAARKKAATAAFFTALSMILGAFIASVAAALGGKARDLHD